MLKTEYKCDTCNKDLTRTSNCEDYRILLTSERIPSVGGFVTMMAIDPTFKRAYHFCGSNCLVAFIKKELPGE